MAAKRKVKKYRKECEYCGKSYTAKSSTSKTCSRACRTAKCRAGQAVEIESVTTVTVTPVTPEIEQPRVSETALEKKLETLIELQIENEKRQARLMDFLEQYGLGGYSINQASDQNVNSFGTNFPMPNKPLVIDDGYQPVPASERYTNDDLPTIEVKVATDAKTANRGEQNFLASLQGLMNG